MQDNQNVKFLWFGLEWNKLNVVMLTDGLRFYVMTGSHIDVVFVHFKTREVLRSLWKIVWWFLKNWNDPGIPPQGVSIYTYTHMYVYIYLKKMKTLISQNESDIFDCSVGSNSLQPHGR